MILAGLAVICDFQQLIHPQQFGHALAINRPDCSGSGPATAAVLVDQFVRQFQLLQAAIHIIEDG